MVGLDDGYLTCDECAAPMPAEIETIDGSYEVEFCPRCGASIPDEMPRMEEISVLDGDLTDMADDDDISWEYAAQELRAHGVPEQRARVVALVAKGHSYREIAARDDVGVSGPGGVGNYVADYRKQRENAQWLADNGPDV